MFIVYILLFLFVLYFFMVILESFLCKQNKFVIYIGIPGSGKSTIASLIAKKDLKKKKGRVFSNFAIKGTYKIDTKEVGYFDVSDSTLILDEIGVDLDNRNWKNNFTKENVYFYKHHRHYNVDIYAFSQSLDMDVKLRNLAREYKVVYKSFFPFFVTSRTLGRKIDVNKETGEVIDRYYWKFASRKRYFMPRSWKLFNSYSRIDLPKVDLVRY